MKRERATSVTRPSYELCTWGDGPLGLPQGQALIQLGMRIRLTHQDKVETLVESQRTKRRRAGEIIAQQGHVMRHQGRSLLRHPPWACGLLAVLLRMTLVWHDVCGGKAMTCACPGQTMTGGIAVWSYRG